MSSLHITLSEQEILQIVGEYLRKRYSLNNTESLVIGWNDNLTPTGLFAATKPMMEPYKNEFE